MQRGFRSAESASGGQMNRNVAGSEPRTGKSELWAGERLEAKNSSVEIDTHVDVTNRNRTVIKLDEMWAGISGGNRTQLAFLG